MAKENQIGKLFSETEPGRQLINRTKRTHLPGFEEFSLFEVWQSFRLQLKKTSLIERASGISFNIVMAIPPTLIFIFTLIPYFPISKQFIHQLFALIRDIIPGERNNSVIIKFLNDFINQPRNGLLSFGLLTAVFFSSNAMMGVLRSFDKDYPGFRKRKNLQRRKVAIKLTIIVLVMIFLCILLLIAQNAVLKYIGIRGDTLRGIIENARWAIVILLTFLNVSLIYRNGPAVVRKWPLFTPGAIFATSLMIIATALVSYWVNHFSNYNKLYGSISAIFILMSLIYANSLAVLMGFELNVTLSILRREKKEQAENLTDEQLPIDPSPKGNRLK